MSKDIAPKFTEFMNPVLEALFKMGGSGTKNEIYEKVSEIMSLSEDVLSVPHKDGQNKVQYRMAWALSYLKKVNLVTNSTRGVWSLVNPGVKDTVNPKEIHKKVHIELRENKKVKGQKADTPQEEPEAPEIEEEDSWQTEALSIIQSIAPDAFERLCQRLLRESGFIEVTVTGKSGDGGIDGHGILRLAGLVSFRVLFQSKRYQGSVTAPQIRDFRGAMIGRADRGLYITTGNFTKDAQKEATRDGAPIIDLVDGVLLVEKLKELRLGIDTQMVEEVVVQKEWFDKI